MSFSPDSISFAEKILLLHYLTTKGDKETKGEYVTFKNLPGASFYNSTYRKRSIERILRAFGAAPKSLLDVSCVLAGQPAELGDVSVRFQVFPKIEATIVLHEGDDEFPPEAQIVFRDEVVNLLPLEDIAVLSGILASRLIKAKKK
jgi:hypothetical protein